MAKVSSGDLGTVDGLAAMRLAVRATISEAFRTPDVIRLFAEKQTGGLRQSLAEIERDVKIGAASAQDHASRKTELLGALKRLGETLTESEEAFLADNLSDAMKDFVTVSPEVQLRDTQAILSLAKS